MGSALSCFSGSNRPNIVPYVVSVKVSGVTFKEKLAKVTPLDDGGVKLHYIRSIDDCVMLTDVIKHGDHVDSEVVVNADELGDNLHAFQRDWANIWDPLRIKMRTDLPDSRSLDYDADEKVANLYLTRAKAKDGSNVE